MFSFPMSRYVLNLSFLIMMYKLHTIWNIYIWSMTDHNGIKVNIFWNLFIFYILTIYETLIPEMVYIEKGNVEWNSALFTKFWDALILR